MLDKIKQLMEMKKQADQIKKELEKIEVEVNEVKGIKIIVTAAQNFRFIEIDPMFLKEANKENLESDLLKSLNLAIQKSQTVAAQKMASVMPGL